MSFFSLMNIFKASRKKKKEGKSDEKSKIRIEKYYASENILRRFRRRRMVFWTLLIIVIITLIAGRSGQNVLEETNKPHYAKVVIDYESMMEGK